MTYYRSPGNLLLQKSVLNNTSQELDISVQGTVQKTFYQPGQIFLNLIKRLPCYIITLLKREPSNAHFIFIIPFRNASYILDQMIFRVIIVGSLLQLEGCLHWARHVVIYGNRRWA